MNALKLKKLIKQNGATFYQQGANHELWLSKSGKIIPIPRHREINENTAKGIIKQSLL
ncbi:type II toxin-antitoxin system HicA family toxin [Anaerobiospirillum thomasii]|uniref:type II toxin-antitoxin system HicA family toxin n=1 Tax=Anaerobiospirillum thomasii TaxID=179995 RepID=UPI000DE5BB53